CSRSSDAVKVVDGATCGYTFTNAALTTRTAAADTSNGTSASRRTRPSTTRPTARAISEDRECVQSSPAKRIAVVGSQRRSGGGRRTSHAAARSRATTKTYELASGDRKVETSLRIGCSLPVL